MLKVVPIPEIIASNIFSDIFFISFFLVAYLL